MPTPADYKHAVEKIQNLNPAAAVFARAHQLIRNPNAQLDEIVNIIKLDTALTADIIRLSNSAAMGSAQPTGNLQAAIGRVGLKAVDRYLGLSISKSVTGHDLECYGISAYHYWSNTISVAILMELLARRLQQDPHEAYTIGILHAVGRLVINQVLRDLKIDACWDESMPIVEWEMALVGFNYAMAGALLLQAWGFPTDIIAVIENQLSPGRLKEASTMVRMLNFSLRLNLMTGVAFRRKDALPSIDPFMQSHNITTEEIQDMITIAQTMHHEAQLSLGITE